MGCKAGEGSPTLNYISKNQFNVNENKYTIGEYLFSSDVGFVLINEVCPFWLR